MTPLILILLAQPWAPPRPATTAPAPIPVSFDGGCALTGYVAP